MSTSSGGGPEFMSTLSKDQKVLAKLFSQIVGKELKNPSRVESNLFSEEQEGTFQQLIQSLAGTQGRLDSSGASNALFKLLNPTTEAKALDPTEVTQQFTKSVANPLFKTFTERLLPEIRRGFQGFSSRSGGATLKAIDDLNASLTSQLAAVQAQTQQFNANLLLTSEAQAQNSRIAGLQLAPGVLNAGTQALGQTLGLQEAKQNKIRADEGANLPINNPALQLALAFTSQSQGQIVDRPAEQTAFGTALTGLASVGASGLTGGLSNVVGGTGGVGKFLQGLSA